MRTGITAAIAASAMLSAVSLAEAGDGWSGYYVGLETGITYNVVSLTDSAFLGSVENLSNSGLVAGAFAGFDRQIGDFVIGGVADIDYVGAPDLVFTGKTDTNYDLNWVATARVRAAWAVNDKVLLFGTGGLALAGASGQINGLGGPTAISGTHLGYVVGAGAEYRFRDNWSLKGEFLHHDFGTVTAPGATSVFRPRLETFKVGLTYRF